MMYKIVLRAILMIVFGVLAFLSVYFRLSVWLCVIFMVFVFLLGCTSER